MGTSFKTSLKVSLTKCKEPNVIMLKHSPQTSASMLLKQLTVPTKFLTSCHAAQLTLGNLGIFLFGLISVFILNGDYLHCSNQPFDPQFPRAFSALAIESCCACLTLLCHKEKLPQLRPRDLFCK